MPHHVASQQPHLIIQARKIRFPLRKLLLIEVDSLTETFMFIQHARILMSFRKYDEKIYILLLPKDTAEDAKFLKLWKERLHLKIGEYILSN